MEHPAPSYGIVRKPPVASSSPDYNRTRDSQYCVCADLRLLFRQHIRMRPSLQCWLGCAEDWSLAVPPHNIHCFILQVPMRKCIYPISFFFLKTISNAPFLKKRNLSLVMEAVISLDQGLADIECSGDTILGGRVSF